MRRVSVYVDGFNLYHAIDKLGDNRLKWLDLSALIDHFLSHNIHRLNSINYFSAYATWKPEAYARHRKYVKALESSGVNAIMGSFKEKDTRCLRCNSAWKKHEEKETDVNIALSILDDAYQDLYDDAIIVSQDSDLFPALKRVQRHFPHKVLKIITPPNLRHSKEMAGIVGKKRLSTIKRIHLERSRFPDKIFDKQGNLIVVAPKEYL